MTSKRLYAIGFALLMGISASWAWSGDGTSAGAIVGWSENIANTTVSHCVERGTIGNFSHKGINLYSSGGAQTFNGSDSYCTSAISGLQAHLIATGTEGLTLQYVTPHRIYDVSGINIYYQSGFSIGSLTYRLSVVSGTL